MFKLGRYPRHVMRFTGRFSTFVFAALVCACGSMTPEGSKIEGMRHPTTEEMQVQQMRVNGVDLAYVEEGKGETVVFVHGSAGDWRNWEGLRPSIARKISLRLIESPLPLSQRVG